MEFRKIVYFLKIAEKKSFSKAAEELFVSPQAISRQIQELETALGYPLFIRTKAKVEMTEKGRAVYLRFAGLRDAWEQAWNDSLEEKTLDLAFFPGLTQVGFLDRLLNILSSKYKDIKIEISSKDIPQIMNGILAGEIDLAYTSFYEGEQYPGCEKIVLQRDPAFAYMPEQHPLSRKDIISMEDLLHSKVIFVKDFHIEKGSVFDKIKRLGEVTWINENFSVIQGMQTGKGIALIPRIYTLEVYPGYLYKPLAQDCSFFFESCLVYKKEHPFAEHFCRIGRTLSTSD